MELDQRSRFADALDEPVRRLLPSIEGYQTKLLVPLSESIKPVSTFFKHIDRYISTALQSCGDPAGDLTQDESAAIYLYTMHFHDGPSLYELLNQSLRDEKRNQLSPWFSFLKLFLTALYKLPSESITVWHGVKGVDLSSRYQTGDNIVWWGVTSCTTNLQVLESKKSYGKTGERTLFSIECFNGKSIEHHSRYKGKENEVILLPGSYFEVIGVENSASQLHTIQLKEMPPPIKFLEPPFHISTSRTVSSQPHRANIFSLLRSRLKIRSESPTPSVRSSIALKPNSKWKQHGITVAGGNGQGRQLNQLSWPRGISVDDNQNIYIADWGNNRVVQWKRNESNGQLVAGGNEWDQLHHPTDVIMDKESDCLIVVDQENRRVMRYFSQDNTSGEMIVLDMDCEGIAMKKNGSIYVSDSTKNEVRRWRRGKKGKGTLVAGGNGPGVQPYQLDHPAYIYVDEDESVYISDTDNHRVMKWSKDSKQGIIVAGGNNEGRGPTQLSCPQGLTVDSLGHIYIADEGNHRVMRWCEGTRIGTLIVGGNERGGHTNQLYGPKGLTFDRQGNLYVVDCNNNRIQKFEVA